MEEKIGEILDTAEEEMKFFDGSSYEDDPQDENLEYEERFNDEFT